MDGPVSAAPLSLAELVEPSRWQRLQDHFASVLGVPLRTITARHELLVNPSWPAGLDADRVIGLLHMGEELDRLVSLQDPPRDISSLTTTLGITYAVVPIRATAESIIAYFIVGPIVAGVREDELQFRQRMTAAGLDAQALWPLILSLKLYTFSSIRSALTLLEEVGTSIVQLAFQAKQLSNLLPAQSAADQAVVTYHTGHILQSLLDAATVATKADGGSVMVYDTKAQALKIVASQGLSDDVMLNTKVKPGEGLAGLAMERRDVLLVDDQAADEGIKQRMNRPELLSSLVAPLTPDAAQQPIGVLSLRTANPQRRFTAEHVELLRRLLDLAGVALGSLRAVFHQARSSLLS